MDAIDPYPFQNKVCGGRGGQLAPHGTEPPLGE
jgi:hypothetical protein